MGLNPRGLGPNPWGLGPAPLCARPGSSHHKGPLIPASPRDAAGISILTRPRSLLPSQCFPEPDGSSGTSHILHRNPRKNGGKKAHSTPCLQRRLFGSSSCFDYFFVLGFFSSLSCGLFLGKFLKKKKSPEKPQSTGKGQEQTKEEGHGRRSSGILNTPKLPQTLPRVPGADGQDGTPTPEC